jgi:hypothetical protein
MIEAKELVQRYSPGTLVEVHNRYTDGWSEGFAVAEPVANGYRLRRLSDGATLPVVFSPELVRQSRRQTCSPAPSRSGSAGAARGRPRSSDVAG